MVVKELGWKWREQPGGSKGVLRKPFCLTKWFSQSSFITRLYSQLCFGSTSGSLHFHTSYFMTIIRIGPSLFRTYHGSLCFPAPSHPFWKSMLLKYNSKQSQYLQNTSSLLHLAWLVTITIKSDPSSSETHMIITRQTRAVSGHTAGPCRPVPGSQAFNYTTFQSCSTSAIQLRQPLKLNSSNAV